LIRKSIVVVLLAAGLVRPLAAQSVDTIVVDNRNIFDRETTALGFLARVADALHVTTRAGVIRRTLLLDQGDRYDSARAVESERALRALGVFRNVKVDTTRLDGRLALRVTTADGWSTRPQGSFSAAGGSVTWGAGLVEKNLLGTANSIQLLYTKTPDRSLYDVFYAAPGLVLRRAKLDLGYENLSDGRLGYWSYGVPFYETAAPASLLTSGQAADQRVLVFRDGALADSVRRRALALGLEGGVALAAGDSGFARLYVFGQWRREAFTRYGLPITRDSASGAAGLGLEVGRARYVVARSLDQFARREDVDVSRRLFLGLYLAPRAFGYGPGRAGVGPVLQAQLGAAWRRAFAWARVSADGVVGGGGVDSGRVEASATLLSQQLARQTLVLHAEGGAARRIAPGTEFDLWLYVNGPRAYGAHVFTGTRRYWLVAEDRILVTPELAGLVGVGLAPFVEWGGAWYGGERPRDAGDVGLALRLGATRSTRGEVTEIALARRLGPASFGGGWAVVVRQAVDFR
jgi:hypothetical protein